MDLVDILLDCRLLGSGKAVFDHQIADMRLPGVIQGKQRLQFLLRKDKAKLAAQEVQPRPDLVHAVTVSQIDDLTHRLGIRVKAIAKDVIFPLFILAGKLHSRQKLRIVLLPNAPDDLAALEGVVVRQREKLQPGRFHIGQDLLRRIGAVGNPAVHMKINFHRLSHASFLPMSQIRIVRTFIPRIL